MRFEEKLKHVLLIDDDPIFIEVLRAFFESHGTSKVLTAQGGNKAKSELAANAGSLDLITCDLNMPEFDGVEFLLHLKSEGVATPLVIISSAQDTTVKMASVLAETYGLNFLGSLSKPLKSEELEARLAPLLSDGEA